MNTGRRVSKPTPFILAKKSGWKMLMTLSTNFSCSAGK